MVNNDVDDHSVIYRYLKTWKFDSSVPDYGKVEELCSYANASGTPATCQSRVPPQVWVPQSAPNKPQPRRTPPDSLSHRLDSFLTQPPTRFPFSLLSQPPFQTGSTR